MMGPSEILCRIPACVAHLGFEDRSVWVCSTRGFDPLLSQPVSFGLRLSCPAFHWDDNTSDADVGCFCLPPALIVSPPWLCVQLLSESFHFLGFVRPKIFQFRLVFPSQSYLTGINSWVVVHVQEAYCISTRSWHLSQNLSH